MYIEQGVIFWYTISADIIKNIENTCKRRYYYSILCSLLIESILLYVDINIYYSWNIETKWWTLYIKIPYMIKIAMLILHILFNRVNPLEMQDVFNHFKWIGSKHYRIVRNLSHYNLLALWYIFGGIDFLISLVLLIIYPIEVIHFMNDETVTIKMLKDLILINLSMIIEFKFTGFVVYKLVLWNLPRSLVKDYQYQKSIESLKPVRSLYSLRKERNAKIESKQ